MRFLYALIVRQQYFTVLRTVWKLSIEYLLCLLYNWELRKDFFSADNVFRRCFRGIFSGVNFPVFWSLTSFDAGSSLIVFFHTLVEPRETSKEYHRSAKFSFFRRKRWSKSFFIFFFGDLVSRDWFLNGCKVQLKFCIKKVVRKHARAMKDFVRVF